MTDRPSGWPLRMAVTELLVPEQQQMGRHFLALGPRHQSATQRAILWDNIRWQVVNGDLIARGVKPGEDTDRVIPAAFLGSLTPDYEGDALRSESHTFHHVRIFRANQAPPERQEPAAGAGRGGRPPKHDWDAFIKEAMTFARYGEFNTRLDLQRHMKDWCAEHWADGPDSRSIERKIAVICPDNIRRN